MGKIVSEIYSNIIGEDRSTRDERKKTRKGVLTARSMINFEPSKTNGLIDRSKGLQLILDSGVGTDIRLLKFTKDSSNNTKLTTIVGDKLYNVTGWRSDARQSIIYANMQTNTNVSIFPIEDVNLGKILVVLDGDYPKYYDYSAVSTLTTHHLSDIGIFDNTNRLWLNDISEPSKFWFSAPGDTTDYVTALLAGHLQIGDDLNKMTAVSNLFVPASSSTDLIIAKQNNIYGITGSSGDPSNANYFSLYEISESVGTRSSRGMVKAGTELFILDDNDIVPYGSLLSSTGVLKTYDIAYPVRKLLSNMNIDYLTGAHMLYNKYDGKAGRLYCFVPYDTSISNDICFVYNFPDLTSSSRLGSWHRRNWQHLKITAADIDPDTNRVYVGDSLGRIYLMDEGYSYDGDPYTSLLDFGFTDFSIPDVTKSACAGSYADIESTRQTNVQFFYIQKNKAGFTTVQDESILFGPKRAQYDIAKFGRAQMTSTYGNKNELNIEGSFESIDIQIETNDKDAGCTVKEVKIMAESKGS